MSTGREQARSQAEDPLVLDEGLIGSVTYRHYRAPRRRSNWRKVATSGAIAVTGRRLVVWAERSRHIDVPLDHRLRSGIDVAVEEPNRVRFAYDAAAFDDAKAGTVEVRLRTAQAARVVELLTR